VVARSRVPVGGHPANVVPFTPPRDLRRTARRDHIPAFWADGRPCSVGCRPAGAIDGWPLKPFHRRHAIRAGLNERRTGSMHVGIDIQARDGQGVYAMQPGYAHILQGSGFDARVQIGNFIYWHIVPRVFEGQYVFAYSTLVGTVKRHFGHLHLSDIAGNVYRNPLRPGGRVLSPWRDTAHPVIGTPRFRSGGRVTVRAYDPQSFVVRTTYPTPVLAPAALAYRLRTQRGRPVTGLEFALRGSQHYASPRLIRIIYTPGARGGGYLCFAYHPRCTPNWNYHLAGGLAPALPPLAKGRYRLTIYAWDWKGNTTARDVAVVVRRRGARPVVTRSR
jgi:hypothetical protein